ncbi:MAG: CDP-alcohol phosphatidyltransferase family protein [Betaproteobacteria bacterium]
MSAIPAVILVSGSVAHGRFCGRTLIDRHVEILRRAGVGHVEIVHAGESETARPERLRGTPRACLMITAERVFDPRLYAAALDTPGSVRLVDRGRPIGLERVASDAGARDLEIDDIDPYSRELRRSLRPFWMPVRNADDRAAVRRLLVDASWKGHQDLPAEFVNRPVEGAVLEWLAETRVSPNQISVGVNVLAYLVVALLGTGHLLAAAIGQIVVGIADGLDGRQARVQVRSSAIGRLEHLFDKVFEVAWMAALAWTLSSGFADRTFAAGLIGWIAAYLLDSGAYDLFRLRRGFQLDEATPLDAAIRRVAGRRNFYAFALLAGVLAGAPGTAFWTIVVWAAATAAVHWLRVAWLLARPVGATRDGIVGS